MMNGLPKWEQVVFSGINIPFQLVGVLARIVLLPFTFLLGAIAILPLNLFLNLFWLVCLVFIMSLSLLTEKAQFLRPLTFVLALPFLLVGHFVNGISVAPNIPDQEAKIEKWDIVEAFPWSWSLFQEKRK